MDNTDWVAAMQRFQPTTPGGAPRAGMGGYGQGNIPYAPGMVNPPAAQPPLARQVAPPMPRTDSAPPQQTAAPQGSPAMSSAPQGGSNIADPATTMQFASLLTAMLMRAAQREQQRQQGGGGAY